MSGPGGPPGGRGWSPMHFRPPSPYGPSPPPRLQSPGMNMMGSRMPHMACPRPRWPSPIPPPGVSPPPIPPGPRPFRFPMHPPSPAPSRATPDFFRGIHPYSPETSARVTTDYRRSPHPQSPDVGPPSRDYEYINVISEHPPLPQNYDPDEEEDTGPSTAEIIANQSQDYVDEKLLEYQMTIYQLQDSVPNPRKCEKDFCNMVDCRDITTCNEGEVLEKGGHCNCCPVCKTLIGLNQYCGPKANNLLKCREGLICRGNYCKKKCH